jgi:hypothetical protein
MYESKCCELLMVLAMASPLLMAAALYGQVSVEDARITGVKRIETTWKRLPGNEKMDYRDPSDVIKVGDTYYVWFSKYIHRRYDEGSYLSYATSKDGITWTEKGKGRGSLIPKREGWRILASPGVLPYKGKYYLYWKSMTRRGSRGNKNQIDMAYADSPDGPWTLNPKNPVLTAQPTKDWPIYLVDDCCLLLREGKIWLYHKGKEPGQHWTKTSTTASWATDPKGPFKSVGKRLVRTNHEVLAWKFRGGVCVWRRYSNDRGLYFAPDGLTFTRMKGQPDKFSEPPGASGFKIASFDNDSDGERLLWGLYCNERGNPMQIWRWEFEYDEEADRKGEPVESAAEPAKAAAKPASPADGAEHAVALRPPPGNLSKAEFKLFVPGSIKPADAIRGVVVISHHEAGGTLYESAAWRGLARRLRCVCLRYDIRNERGGTSREQANAEAIKAALELLAKKTGHAELAHSCILPTGLSAGGWQAALLVNTMPQRVIGAIGIHGLGEMPSKEARKVPVLATIAARDRLVSDRPMPIILGGRKAGAPWAAVIEPNLPHHQNGDQTLNTMWAAAVIRLRVPERIAKDRPVNLRDVDLADGFLGRLLYTKKGERGDMTVKEAEARAFKDFAGDKTTAHWLPDKATAEEWVAVQSGKRVRAIDTTTRPTTTMPARRVAPAAGKGTPEAPVQVARLTGKIRIDGEASDWAGVPALPAPFSGKAAGALRLAWTPQGL